MLDDFPWVPRSLMLDCICTIPEGPPPTQPWEATSQSLWSGEEGAEQNTGSASRSPGEGNGTLLQYSCLENPMDRGAWGFSPGGRKESRHDWATSLSLFLLLPSGLHDCDGPDHWNRKLKEIFAVLILHNTGLIFIYWSLGFSSDSAVKNTWSAGDAGHAGSIPESGRSSGGGNGDPLQYSCLGNSMDRGAWWATVHGVSKSRTRLNN